jgi:hypothetical protein
MAIAILKQNLQDWITQQWVITFGRKISSDSKWLLGPFGSANGIGSKYIDYLAQEENLIIDKKEKTKGLIQSIDQLNLPKKDSERLSKDVVDFYENTSDYSFELKVDWNPLFKIFGKLVKLFFSNRIEQLNVPIKDIDNSETLSSEIIHLLDSKTNSIKRTIWLRKFIESQQIVYSGIYETCKIPSGQVCMKAIFPLPNGNATVILSPKIGNNGELILDSSGNKFGESGFYFLLRDSSGQLWTKFIKSFQDKLVVSSENENIRAIQTLTLWNLRVLKFEYSIKKLHTTSVKRK